MAMTSCHECAHSISTSARSCPQCGANVPRTKWWLWIPLGVLALFIGFGFTIPEDEYRARQIREGCKAAVDPLHCREMLEIATGRANSGKANSGKSGKGYEAPVDRALVEATEKKRVAQDAKMLQECKQNITAKKTDYQRLMSRREYWAASLALRRCSELQDDAALKSLVADAEQKQYIMEIEAPRTTREVRDQAIEALLRDYPEVGRKYEKRLKR